MRLLEIGGIEEVIKFAILGVVMRADESWSVIDDESDEGRVHILVHSIVPPFLDGRIVFTKVENRFQEL